MTDKNGSPNYSVKVYDIEIWQKISSLVPWSRVRHNKSYDGWHGKTEKRRTGTWPCPRDANYILVQTQATMAWKKAGSKKVTRQELVMAGVCHEGHLRIGRFWTRTP